MTFRILSTLNLSARGFRCGLAGGHQRRHFAQSAAKFVVKPFILADIGEGIKEVQIIQWFVEPGARVEQFQKICEVQSDKAAVEEGVQITSRFDGVIKKLYYEADDTAEVGKPLCDIDIEDDVSLEDEGKDGNSRVADEQQPQQVSRRSTEGGNASLSRHATLATPAVRFMLKEHGVRIEDITGTGKDGRVLKEDVHRHVSSRHTAPETQSQIETVHPLNSIQLQMFKAMTRSLSIPHFLYTDEVDVSALSSLRRIINTSPISIPSSPSNPPVKLTYLPFLIKAFSIALSHFPLLNTRVDETESVSPKLVYRSQQNISIAIATPHGLVVPVIRNVSHLTIPQISSDISRLQALAVANKLAPIDLSGGTFTVSNIGSIGGTVVAPILVPDQVCIVGLGRARDVVGWDAKGELVKKTVMTMSWSADHRVIDGATVARCAEMVRELILEPGRMVALMR